MYVVLVLVLRVGLERVCTVCLYVIRRGVTFDAVSTLQTESTHTIVQERT